MDGGDFATALRAAITARGLSLQSLQRQLRDHGIRVSAGALSHWQTGTRVPSGPASLEALSRLEELLALAPGDLRTLLRRTRRQGRPPAQASYSEFSDTPPQVDLALAELGLLGDTGLAEISAHVDVRVDAHRNVVSATNRQVFRATRDGASALPAMLMDEPYETPPLIEAVHGCRLGRRIDHPAVGVSVVEIVLAEPLAEGAAAALETRLHFPEYEILDEDDFGYHLTTRLRECLLWVRFHPDAVPVDAEAYTLTPTGGRTPRDLHLDDTELQVVIHDFGPGRLYLKWYW